MTEQASPLVPRRAIYLMYLLTAGFWFTQYAITPYINAELTRMGATASIMGLVGGIYGLTQLLVRIPLGMAADWMGRQKPFIVAGCLLSAIACTGYLLWYTPMSFVVWRGIAGLASASWVSFTVLFGSYFPIQEGPTRISQLNIFNQIGRLLCFVVMGVVVARYSLSHAYLGVAIFGLMILLLSLMIREQPHPPKGLTIRSFKEVARDRNLMVCSLLGLLTQVVAFGSYLGFVSNLALRLDASRAQLSQLSIALVIPTVLFNYLGASFVYRRLKPRTIVALGFLAGLLFCILAPLCQNLTQLYLCMALAALSSAGTFAFLLGLCVRDIVPQLRSAAMGFFQSVYGIGMTLGPLLMGLMIDMTNLNAAFFGMAGLCLVSAALAYRTL